MAKMSIVFNGFKELMESIDKAGGSIENAAREALEESQKIIQREVQSAAAPYASGGLKGYATGAMHKAILKNAQVAKHGAYYEVPVGFDLDAHGGYHSIFVMHGTYVYGTPRIAKDMRLYNAVFGAKVKREIAETQERILGEHLRLAGGK